MITVLKLKQNDQGQDWFVGDIHGCFSILENQLEAIQFDPSVDRLICTGDLIDRGPESERALEFIQQPWFYSVMGNHDSFVLGDLGSIFHQTMWYANGGSWWWNLNSIEKKNEITIAFSKLPYAIEIETSKGLIGVIHAELPVGMSWTELTDSAIKKNITESLLWGRKRLTNNIIYPVEHIDLLVSGHTMLNQPVRLANCVFIDVGACIRGSFILINLDDLFNLSLADNEVDIICKQPSTESHGLT